MFLISSLALKLQFVLRVLFKFKSKYLPITNIRQVVDCRAETLSRFTIKES